MARFPTVALMAFAVPAAAWFKRRERIATCEKLTATFDAGHTLKATVTAEEVEKQIGWYRTTYVKWSVDIEEASKAQLCPSGQLNWHVHARSSIDPDGEGSVSSNGGTGTDVGASCGKAQTGGHVDPTARCGGASDLQGTECCTGVTYDCPAAGQKNAFEQRSCEKGDQSGKMGKIDLGTAHQSFEDYYIDSLETYEGLALVLHCCSDSGCVPRVACANLACADRTCPK